MHPAEAARLVVEAWSRPGPAPWRHALAKKRLRRDWPALATAVEQLAEAWNDDRERSP
jgi:hypothetical protein